MSSREGKRAEQSYTSRQQNAAWMHQKFLSPTHLEKEIFIQLSKSSFRNRKTGRRTKASYQSTDLPEAITVMKSRKFIAGKAKILLLLRSPCVSHSVAWPKATRGIQRFPSYKCILNWFYLHFHVACHRLWKAARHGRMLSKPPPPPMVSRVLNV